MDNQKPDFSQPAGPPGDAAEAICPQCGSTDTAPIHQEPMWASNDEPDPSVKDPPWHRCLTCRHKWRTDRV